LRFVDLKISAKILSLMLTLSLVAAGLLGFAVLKMSAIDTSYSRLLDSQVAATVHSIRANRLIVETGYGAFRTITNPGASSEAKEGAEQSRQALAGAAEQLADAAKVNPVDAGSYAEFQHEMEALQPLIEAAISNGLADRNAEANAAMSQATAKLRGLSARMVSFNNAEIAQTQQMSDANTADVRTAVLSVVVVGAAAILAALALAAWLTARTISRPLVTLSGVMATLAKGDTSREIEGDHRRDEVGEMARSVLVFRQQALENRRLEGEAETQRGQSESERRRNEAAREKAAQEQQAVVTSLAAGLDQLSRGMLTTRLSQPFAEDYEGLRRDFNAAVEKLERTLGDFGQSTKTMASGTAQISEAAADLSKRTEQQAATLEETAAAMEQITATVRRTAEGAQNSARVVGQAKSDAQRSGVLVAEATEAMSRIESSSDQIAQIIGVIDEIAFQTNLLALNAGVEAARAGDSGKGFAVVASEVRALAQRSADAAREIKVLIEASGAHVGQGVSLVGATGEALKSIVSQVESIAGSVGEIAVSAQEQAVSLGQVNTAISQMDQVTQQNAAMVEQSTAASQNLANEAVHLERLMAQFQIGGVQASARVSAAAGAPAAAAPARPKPALARSGGYASGAATARKLQPAAAPDAWEEF
jgi:methyl-accepting chemotaxis protein